MDAFNGIKEIKEIELKFDKLHKFFNQYENQQGLVAPVTDSEFAITVKGDFSWGFKHAEEEKETKEEDVITRLKNKISSICRKKPIEVEVKDIKEDKKLEVNRKFDTYIQLKEIDLKIKKGEFVCIIGETSSGKTTLLRTMVGETAYVKKDIIKEYNQLDMSVQNLKEITRRIYLDKLEENPITQSGTTGYTEQVPWLQKMTLRDNILFGKAFDQKLYDETIEAC